MVYRKNPLGTEELRRQALARLEGAATGIAQPSPDEARHLMEELAIHQIELEMQNEHLNEARNQLEMALQRSGELYDFAPVAHVSIDRTGSISRLNLAAAQLLGGERATLLGAKFSLYVPEAERLAFNALLEQVLQAGDVQGAEYTLVRPGSPALHVELRVSMLSGATGWQLILVDSTARKQFENRLRISEERWKLALEAAGDGVWDWNVQTGEIAYSRRFESLFGFAEGEFGDHMEDWSVRIHPVDKAGVMSGLQVHLAGATASFYSEHRALCKDGSWKWVLSRGAVVSRDESGKALRMIGTYIDITDRKKTEEALSLANQLQQAVFDSLSAQIAVLDRHGNIQHANASWLRYAGSNGLADLCGFVGSNYLDCLDKVMGNDPEIVLEAAAGISQVIAGTAPHFQMQYAVPALDETRYFIMKVTPVHDEDRRVVVSNEDVTKLKAAELASLTLLNVDALTGALSRRNFLALAEQELARSLRYKQPLMLLMLDLDNFKLINDNHGHAAGDAVLQDFVATVMGVLRESDLIGRLGGEEFAILLPGTTLEGGQTLAERIVDVVRSHEVKLDGQSIRYTVSIGASRLQQESGFSDLLRRADMALYKAKKAGRNRMELDLP